MREVAAVGLLVLGVVGGSAAAPPVAIRGLPAEEVEDLRQGRGMGLARAADLAGYPGPRHVLDAAATGRLPLTADQLETVRRLFDTMSAEARRLGARILDEEAGLEAAFREGTIGEAELAARVDRVGALRAELRRVHLRAHLQTRALLDADQLARYAELRRHDGAAAHH